MFSYQKTVSNEVQCSGVGLHSGVEVHLTIKPAGVDEGITFIRLDVADKDSVIPAHYLNVSNTMLGTTLCNEDGVHVATIEHLMAALWGCGVDNCVIELDGPEVPIMDGSSEPFVFLIECAGTAKQEKTRKVIEILKEVRVTESEEDDSGYISIQPSEGFSVGLEIDYKDNVVSNQHAVFDTKDVSFKSDLCRARTFGFAHEVDYLQSQGLAKGGSLDNAIVVGDDGILNEDNLRYSDEFVRHKILDCIGDVYLAGACFKGHLNGLNQVIA